MRIGLQKISAGSYMGVQIEGLVEEINHMLIYLIPQTIIQVSMTIVPIAYLRRYCKISGES